MSANQEISRASMNLCQLTGLLKEVHGVDEPEFSQSARDVIWDAAQASNRAHDDVESSYIGYNRQLFINPHSDKAKETYEEHKCAVFNFNVLSSIAGLMLSKTNFATIKAMHDKKAETSLPPDEICPIYFPETGFTILG